MFRNPAKVNSGVDSLSFGNLAHSSCLYGGFLHQRQVGAYNPLYNFSAAFTQSCNVLRQLPVMMREVIKTGMGMEKQVWVECRYNVKLNIGYEFT